MVEFIEELANFRYVDVTQLCDGIENNISV